MTIGSVDVSIVINAGGYNLLGSTCTLIAAPGYFQDLGLGIELGPVTVNPGGLSGTYLTTGVDFEAAGPWMLWLKVEPSNGSGPIYSDPAAIFINPLPRLAA